MISVRHLSVTRLSLIISINKMPRSEQGVSKDRYALIPRTLIFLTRGEKVLLLKGSPQKRLWANRYNGVGGHIEKGEDYLTAARRELWEETGLKVNDLFLCGIVIVDTGEDIGICIFMLKGKCDQGEPVPSGEGEPEWISVSELDKYPLVEDLPKILPRILAMKPTDPTFSARYSYNSNDELEVVFVNR